MTPKYQVAAVGGTFDRLHQGHYHLLQTAYSQAQQVVIGLTTSKIIQHKTLGQIIMPFAQRKQELQDFITAQGFQSRTSIIPLNDIYGPTLDNGHIDVLVVSRQTKPGALAINRQRQALNKSPLPIVVTPLVKDESGQYISSTRIRQGLIDRQGRVYQRLFLQDHRFTSSQKMAVKSPQGKLFKNEHQLNSAFLSSFTKIILVGDSVTQSFINRRLPFNHAIIDHLVNRHPYQLDYQSWQPQVKLQTSNPPGSITQPAARQVAALLSQNHSLLEVDGEEDLLGFPVVLYAPLKSAVLYGQPQKGIVMIEVTEKIKQTSAYLLDSHF